MSKLNRRKFIKLLGGGTAALGMGISGRSWAAQAPPGPPQTPQVQQKTPDDLLDCDAWEIYYPDVFDDAEQEKVIKGVRANLEQINKRGDIDVKDLISGKLDGTPGIGGRGPGGGTKITLENMMTNARRWGADNPIFTDREYAKKTKYGDLIAVHFIVDAGGWPSIPSTGMGDYKLVSDLNVSLTFHKPVYEGDTIFSVIDRQDCEDITPASGSRYRTWAISGTGRAFNQKGELVVEGSHIVKESYRRHKDPAKRFIGGGNGWESPEWWYYRPPHIYTDEDWEEIKEIWKNERIRGSKVLYWDDVKIGDEPPPRAIGPILTEVEADMHFDIPDWSTDTKKYVLDSKTFAKMVKNKQGVYVLPEHLERKPAQGPSSTMGGGIPELAHRDWRGMIQNSVAAKWAAGMLYNWMGDEGWLQRFGWDIMAKPVGYPDYVIPPYPYLPALFDKFPFMEKVPYMKGKRADCHAMENDLVISKAYVFDKYRKGGEYFVDLTWWCETLDKYIVEEGFATVKLPKK
jgi:acyl dehydratase